MLNGALLALLFPVVNTRLVSNQYQEASIRFTIRFKEPVSIKAFYCPWGCLIYSIYEAQPMYFTLITSQQEDLLPRFSFLLFYLSSWLFCSSIIVSTRMPTCRSRARPKRQELQTLLMMEIWGCWVRPGLTVCDPPLLCSRHVDQMNNYYKASATDETRFNEDAYFWKHLDAESRHSVAFQLSECELWIKSNLYST